jgi:PDZ domain-containing protein
LSYFRDIEEEERWYRQTLNGPTRTGLISKFLGSFWAKFVAFAVASFVVFSWDVPYVILHPTVPVNILGEDNGTDILEVVGHTSYPTDGALALTAVSFEGSRENPPSLYQLLAALVDPKTKIYNVDVIEPVFDGPQVNVPSGNDIRQSENAARAMVLRRLGISFKARVFVNGVYTEAPAWGSLEGGDYIETFNGHPVRTETELRQMVQASGNARNVQLGIERDGQKKLVKIKLAKYQDSYFMGILPGEKYAFPFKIKITLTDLDGPSAGLMFALSIYDELTPGNLTGGERFSGTGTISQYGTVGAIGGIRQKMIGAADAGYKYFFAPAPNCSEVVGNVPAGLRVFKIRTFDDALRVIDTVTSRGNIDTLPTCTN